MAARQQVTDTALDPGAKFVDSSPMYGHAERILGATLAARRAEAIVATKVWTPDDAEAERQIDASLAYFGGHVEVFQVHNLVAWRTRLDQLERRRDGGEIDIVAATHWRVDAFDELEDGHAHRADRRRPGAVQPARARRRAAHLPARRGARHRRDPDATVRRRWARRAEADAPPISHRWPTFGVTTWPQALLKYGLSHPATAVSIPATTTRPERMAENAAAGDGPWFGPDEKALVGARWRG